MRNPGNSIFCIFDRFEHGFACSRGDQKGRIHPVQCCLKNSLLQGNRQTEKFASLDPEIILPDLDQFQIGLHEFGKQQVLLENPPGRAMRDAFSSGLKCFSSNGTIS